MPASRLSKAVASVSAAAVLLSTLFALPAAAVHDPAIDSRPVAPPSTAKAAPPTEASSRFVVKFKTGASGAAMARAKAYGQVSRTSGIPVKELGTTATGATVVQASETLTPSESASVVASLRGQSNVDYVERDTFVRPAATVWDPLFQYQWDLSESAAGMRVPAAWDVTTGRGATVAVIDTGITSHSDLSSNIVPGYDFISDPSLSNDGDGRDTDATDAGDYCNGAASSWHGTHVAGTIAAVANNGRGVAGVAYGAKVQPLRALGSCGGYLSDIADAVVWAAGGAVSEVPANTTPAKVINMSLGGSGECSIYFQSALDFAAAQGVAVVAAAGNENTPTSGSTPANCDKIITVGATGRAGSRAFYSNYGPEVDVSAPGGDASTSGYDAILSTWNDGQTTAGTEAYGFMQGTSMAAPHVAAVAALMMTAGSTVTPAGVEAKLKSTARPLPGSCDTSGCGTGLVDAGAAVRASMPAPPALTPGKPSIAGTPQAGQTLTAQEGTWTPSVLIYGYEWLRNGNSIPDATERTYQPNLGDLGASISVRVGGYKPGWGSATAVSDPVLIPEPTPIGVIPIATPEPSPTETSIPEPSSTETSVPVPSPTEAATAEPSPTETAAPPAYAPKIVGEAKVGSTLTAEESKYGLWTYQWSNSDGPIEWATGKTYEPKPSDLGKTITVTVTVHTLSLDEDTVTGTSAATAPVVEGTFSAPKPTIAGSPVVGQILSAVPGTWSAGATMSYQWYRDDAAVSTAKAASYITVAEDLGRSITVRVTGAAAGYTSLTVESEPTAPVAAGALAGPAPTITGTAAVGQTLQAAAGTWAPNITLGYQWYRNGIAVLAATTASHTLGADDLGKTFTVTVTGTRAGYSPLTLGSAPTASVVAGTLSASIPTIPNKAPKLGVIVLAADMLSTWPSGTHLSKSWYRAGVQIPNSDSVFFTPHMEDVGKTLTIRVTGTKAGYAPLTLESAPTAPVLPGTLADPTPTITGIAKVGSTITAHVNVSVWPSYPFTTKLTYQWLRSGALIPNADGATYVAVPGDLGKTIAVRVTGTKTGYATLVKDSAPTAAVAAGTLTAPAPTISGTRKVGYTLTAAPGTWTSGATLRYQWYRSGVAIAGATASRYTLAASDLGKAMKVRVTGTKAGYTTVTKDSARTSAIVAGTLAAPTPWISGTPRYGYTLTANTGTWTAGTTLRYQWYRSGAAIAGATGKWYRLVAADRYDTIKVRVVGSKAGYSTVIRFSGSTLRIP